MIITVMASMPPILIRFRRGAMHHANVLPPECECAYLYVFAFEMDRTRDISGEPALRRSTAIMLGVTSAIQIT